MARTISGTRIATRNFGYCLSFPVSGKVEVVDNNFDGLANGTLEFFIKIGIVSAYQKVVFKNGTIDIGLDGSGDIFGEIVGVGNLGGFSSGGEDDDIWHHIAMTWDGSWLRGYVDGVYINRTAQAGSQDNNANALFLGRRDGTEPYYGLLDEFRISNIARYTTQTSFAIPTEPFVNDANTLILFHFDEGSGSSVTDSSGNGNTGTITNAVYKPVGRVTATGRIAG